MGLPCTLLEIIAHKCEVNNNIVNPRINFHSVLSFCCFMTSASNSTIYALFLLHCRKGWQAALLIITSATSRAARLSRHGDVHRWPHPSAHLHGSMHRVVQEGVLHLGVYRLVVVNGCVCTLHQVIVKAGSPLARPQAGCVGAIVHLQFAREGSQNPKLVLTKKKVCSILLFAFIIKTTIGH